MGLARRRVLVAGATGYLGAHVTRALHEAGHFVRALARDVRRLEDLTGQYDEGFQGEATRPASLRGLCDGIEVVFSSLGVRSLRRSPTVWDVDWKANLNLLNVARRAGVSHFIFVSVFHGPEIRDAVPAAEARERVVDALASEAPPFTVLRPTGFFNDMLEFLQMARSGRVWLPGSGETRINPVHGADVAAHVADAVAMGPQSSRPCLDIGGPEVFTLREVGALAFEVLGAAPRYGRIPLAAMDALAGVTAPFNANAGSLLKMLTSLARLGAVAPPSGAHRLRTFFEQHAGSCR